MITFAGAGVGSERTSHSLKLRYLKSKRPIIKGAFPLSFSTRRPRMPGALFPLYHSPSNLSIGKINKIITKRNPVFVQHYLLTFGAVCGILLVSRGDREHLFQVDLGTVCGGREKSAETLGKSQSSKKNSKNPLTNHSICDIIQIQSGGKSPLSALVRRHEE